MFMSCVFTLFGTMVLLIVRDDVSRQDGFAASTSNYDANIGQLGLSITLH
jgi:hypothetical protein